jgi:glycosyltransferase involved in cell wall biosynthesis
MTDTGLNVIGVTFPISAVGRQIRGDLRSSMRILFATGLKHLPQAVGGSQRLTDELCKGLTARGVECAVLASVGADDFLGFRTRALAKVVSWSRVPADRTLGYPVFRRWFPARAIADVAARFRPSAAVVMAGAPSSLIDSLLASGVPTLQFILDALPDTLSPELTARPGLAFFACSQFLAEIAERLSGIEPAVIPPIVDASRYRVETSRHSVVLVNPIVPKGVEIALRLAEARPDIPFEFVECWELNPEDMQRRKRAESMPNITWHSRMLDLRPIYARARVLLAPSQWDEGWGRVVSEAQASGIPVLASRRGGLPEAVGPGGILVDPDNNISAWKEALSRLWDDEEAYRNYSAAALSHSLRPEIRPEYVLTKLTDCLARLGNSRAQMGYYAERPSVAGRQGD